MGDLRSRLAIPSDRLRDINALLSDPDSALVDELLAVVAKYGTPEAINAKAAAAGRLPALLDRVRAAKPEYLGELEWLKAKRLAEAFVPVAEYRRRVLGGRHASIAFDGRNAVTLEVSAVQYFPWLMAAARKAESEGSLLPGRWIKVRKMKEQEADGDLAAIAAAMEIIGASLVETLDTKGTDGSNVHLNGPSTIAGYFGGIGQPNRHALDWIDEYLYYYTNYGIRQVLNVNAGTVFLGFLLYRLGVDIQFKISVFFGSDNPYHAAWTMMAARLLARDDGSTPLVGFNWSNSVDNATIEAAAEVRKALGFEREVRFEHHITETYKSIVRQPYDRRAELLDLAAKVANVSAKHEGGDPAVDASRAHQSDVLDYFRDKAEVIASGDWDALELNFLDKVDAMNATARALTERGLSFVAAEAHARG